METAMLRIDEIDLSAFDSSEPVSSTECTFAEFCAVNPGECHNVWGMPVGASTMIGGGAAPLYRVTRTA
jgi:hypothetical protein